VSRAAPECPHRPPCPGCPRWGEPGPPRGALAALAALCAEHGIAPPRVEAGPRFGWRHRARLMVRGRAGAPEVGLFRAGSHRIVDVPRCAVHHPRVNEVAAALRRALRETGIAPYADAPHAGLVRALQVVVERAGGRAQVALVTRSERADEARPLFAALRAELGERLHSLWWNGNPARTNAILGPLWERIAGDEMLRESIAGAAVFFPPGAFGQANLPLAEGMAEEIARRVPEGARVAEFYAGTGAIGLALLARGRAARIALNEREAASLAGLERGLAALPAALRRRGSLAPGPAGSRADLVAGADAVVVDPPRRGLDPELLDALRAAPPPLLVYASCGLEPFLREARALAAAGLRPVEIAAYDFFPFADHLETLAFFARGGGGRPGDLEGLR
jgi:tRNA/tmRNA/rRNA uracil-C5-methylase (TrmA/RlmC/RlmD family)